ncbi:dipeptide epimerase [Psychrobacillus sp. INOP01]|uniref:mandelate racemase/muconate lactonizing enzyme family protein n=1 Tax=Psychrobacillus sp. INOP01 TaxID=2829187 RepID=UPI001BA96B64|nr:dipeptide epimerase [Psychrobacillus sp. INOP01]QUG42758.1 dipeptide epimerase [Psychrobacillus sp. INOP01]
MKIISIQVNAIHLPFKNPFTIAYETYKVMPSLILKMETDDGLVGYGEAVPDQHVTGETWESTLSNIKNYLAPVVLGENPFNIEKIHDKMNAVLHYAPTAKAAIDIACYDLMGKVAKQPIFNLLGGAYYQSLSITHVIGMGTNEEMIKEAKSAIDQGYSELKIKVGNTPREDVQLVAEIRKAVGPKIKLRLDANQGWKQTTTALQALKELEKYYIDWMEQPIIAANRVGLAELHQRTSIPIMADESIHGAEQLRELISLNAIDLINIKLMKCGGIYPAQQLVHQAQMAGISCIIGSMIESSISTAAGAHLALSKKNVVANELGSPLIFSKDIAPMMYKKNKLFVPQQPGLGIQVNEELLKRLSIRGEEISSSL